MKNTKILLVFLFVGINSAFAIGGEDSAFTKYSPIEVVCTEANLDIFSVPKLEESESVATANGKYTNQEYSSPDEPSALQLYKYCIDELFVGLPTRFKKFFYKKPALCKKFAKQICKDCEHDLDKEEEKKTNKKKHDSIIKSFIQKSEISETSIKPKITWFQHSSFLIQISGINILVDPVFCPIKGCPAIFELVYKPEDLPPVIDVVLISHNHVEHLDIKSLRAVQKRYPHAVVCVPVGDGNAVKEKCEFKNVYEFGWQNKLSCSKTDPEADKVTFTFLPTIHWSVSSISPKSMNTSHWGSWMISSKNFNIYFSADTHYNKKLFEDIKKQFLNIDVAIMGIGPNGPPKSVDFVHLNAERAVQAFIDLNADRFIPCHWGTYKLGTDYFIEPLEKLALSWFENLELLQNKKMCLLPFGGNVEFGFRQEGPHESLDTFYFAKAS